MRDDSTTMAPWEQAHVASGSKLAAVTSGIEHEHRVHAYNCRV